MPLPEVISLAIGYLQQYKLQLAKALVLPFLLLLAVNSLEFKGYISLVFTFVALLLKSIFAITVHRFILLEPDSVPNWGIRLLSKRELFFILNLLCLIIFVIPTLLLGRLHGLVIVCWLSGRISLVFPSIATDNEVTVKTSWKLTKKYQRLLSFIVFLFITIILFSFIPNNLLIASFIELLAIVLVAALLSVVYRFIREAES